MLEARAAATKGRVSIRPVRRQHHEWGRSRKELRAPLECARPNVCLAGVGRPGKIPPSENLTSKTSLSSNQVRTPFVSPSPFPMR